jgi:TolA-binding protein
MIFENKQRIRNPLETEKPAIRTQKKTKKIIIISITSIVLVVAAIVGITQYFAHDVTQQNPLTIIPNNTSIINDEPIVSPAEDKNEVFSTGLSLYEDKNYSDAANSFNRLLQLEPNNASALYLRGSSQQYFS